MKILNTIKYVIPAALSICTLGFSYRWVYRQGVEKGMQAGRKEMEIRAGQTAREDLETVLGVECGNYDAGPPRWLVTPQYMLNSNLPLGLAQGECLPDVKARGKMILFVPGCKIDNMGYRELWVTMVPEHIAFIEPGAYRR